MAQSTTGPGAAVSPRFSATTQHLSGSRSSDQPHADHHSIPVSSHRASAQTSWRLESHLGDLPSPGVSSPRHHVSEVRSGPPRASSTTRGADPPASRRPLPASHQATSTTAWGAGISTPDHRPAMLTLRPPPDCLGKRRVALCSAHVAVAQPTATSVFRAMPCPLDVRQHGSPSLIPGQFPETGGLTEPIRLKHSAAMITHTGSLAGNFAQSSPPGGRPLLTSTAPARMAIGCRGFQTFHDRI